MKSNKLLPIILTFVIAFMTISCAIGQRVIQGTVYRDGKPAAGVTVDGHKAKEAVFTSFDGAYKLDVPTNCKYIKFTFIDDSRKLSIEGNNSDVIDFSFEGEIPVATEKEEPSVNLKTSTELVAARNKDYMSTYTLEKQFYDQKDFKSCMAPWRILYKKFPKSSENIYIHGLNIYQNLIENTKDLKLKDLYIDTLMMVYDRRIKYFDDRGSLLGRQGVDFFKYKLANENISDSQRKVLLKKGFNYIDESVKLQGMNSDVPVLILLMNSTRGLFALGEFGKEKVIEVYDLVSKISSNYLVKEPTNQMYLDTRVALDQIFQTSGAADCDALISIYTPKFNVISQNIEDLKKMIRMLDRQSCDGSELYSKASEKLYALEPSAEAAYNMARLFVKAEQLGKAEGYYKQAVSLEKDPLSLSKYYLELAKLNFSKPSEARGYIKKSIENNPNSGSAYMLLGNLYAYNSKSYGENDFERTFVFMVATDYYAKAKRVDSSVEAEANEKIGTYSQYFPSKEDIFFNGLSVGKAVTLGGWIQESTTIREKR